MLDREGLAGPADLALVGDEATLRCGIERIASAGTTDFAAALIEDGSGSAQHTLDFLQSCLQFASQGENARARNSRCFAALTR